MHSRAKRRLIDEKLKTATSQNDKVRLLVELLDVLLDPSIRTPACAWRSGSVLPPERLAAVAVEAMEISRAGRRHPLSAAG